MSSAIARERDDAGLIGQYAGQWYKGQWFKDHGWGLALVLVLAVGGMALSKVPAIEKLGLSGLTMAIILGIVAGNSVFGAVHEPCAKGVDFAKSNLLRLGVILFGFHVSFQEIAAVGPRGILIDVIMIGSTFSLATYLGTRLFKLDRETAMLIGVGSSICGAAAVVAAEPVIKGQAHKVSVAVATVVVFGTLGMFLYPLAFPYLHMSDWAYGVYAGSTIHEVAQVVGAARPVSESAAATAVIVKMLRVMLLAPFLIILGGILAGRDGRGGETGSVMSRITIPWFAVLFIVASGINSLHVVPAPAVNGLLTVDTLLLAMAMAALGLRTHVGAFKQAGVRPLLLATVLFLFLSIGGYAVNRAVMAFV